MKSRILRLLQSRSRGRPFVLTTGLIEPAHAGCYGFLNLPLLAIVCVVAALPAVAGEAPEDYFHQGATNFVFEKKQEAKKVVETGLKRFPDDVPLQKLLELLKEKENQQQQQDDKDQKQDDKKDQQQKQQDQKDQQQKNEQQQNEQKKDEQNQKQDQKDSQGKQGADEKDKQDAEKRQSQKPQDQGEKGDQDQAGKMTPMQMTPQQAAQLLDAHKGEERVLLFTPQLLRTNRQVNRTKDW